MSACQLKDGDSDEGRSEVKNDYCKSHIKKVEGKGRYIPNACAVYIIFFM